MAHVFTTYLWKEYRDQRAALGWLGALLVSLAALALFLLPRRAAGDEIFLVTGIFVSLLVYLLIIGPDFLARERNEGRVRFLERVPGGLHAAFGAKLVLFFVSATSFGLLGLALTAGISYVRTGAAPVEFLSDANVLFYLVPIVAVATWTFTAAAWVPRGAFGLPAAVLVLAALGWPLWLFYVGAAWLEPLDDEIALYAGLSILGAPISGGVAFTVGNRFGRSRTWAAACGLLMAALFLTPAWGWTGVRVLDALRVDPTEEGTRMLCGLVDVEGRYAYVTAQRELPRRPGEPRRELPTHALVIDLHTGEWHSEGTGSWWRVDRGWNAIGAFGGEPVAHVFLMRYGDSGEGEWYDAVLAREQPEAPTPSVLASLPSDVHRGIANDGDHWYRAGLGFGVRGRDGGGWDAYYDPFRDRLFKELDVFPGGGAPPFWRLAIRPGRWLFLDPRSRMDSYAVDPETGERSPVPGLTETTKPGPLLRDGFLLVVEGGDVYRLDPDTGDRQPVALTGERPPSIEYLYPFRGELIDATGSVFVMESEGWRPGRYDPDRLTLHFGPPCLGTPGQVLSILDDDSGIAIQGDHSLIRFFLDGRETEVLFPRSERQ